MEALLKPIIDVYQYTEKERNSFRILIANGDVNLLDFDVNELHYLLCQNIIKESELTTMQLVELFSRSYLDLENLTGDQLLELLKYL